MSSGFKELHSTRTGPWGKLEYYYTFLDPPEYIFEKCTREVTEWAFIDHDRPGAEAFLSGCGIDLVALNRDCRWIAASNGTVVRPSHRFVESLSKDLRQNLYSRLIKRFGGNAHLHEFVVERGAFRENCAGLDIPESLVRLVEERSVKIGKKTIFPETAYALSLISEPGTRLRFLKGLARGRALVARLRISPDSNLEQIAKWWKAGPNRTRALPLLQTALRTPGVDTLDVIHLLPPVPRRLLNTFSGDLDDHDGSKPDCFWAAMNFFGETASNRYLDFLPRQYYLHEKFDQIRPGASMKFGDVVIITDFDGNQFIHAYVHIADDIVFTKNGSGRYFPYILMRRDDLMSRYVEDPAIRCDIYRLRSF